MIIHMDDYRKVDEVDARQVERERYEQARRYANGMLALQQVQAERSPQQHLPTPLLPLDFEDFDAKDFITRASALATQI